MQQKLPPDLVQPLAKAIGKTFEFPELDAIVFRSTGGELRLFEDLVGAGDPTVTTAFKLLIEIEKRGFVTLFLAYVLSSRPADTDLRELIGKACPPSLTAEVETRKQVPTVLAGLAATKGMLADPAVKAALTESRDALTSLVRDIEVLEVYKNLHECLHQLQLKPSLYLRSLAKRLATDASQINILREYDEQIKISYSKARDSADRLADALKGIETVWIDDLENASEKYLPALDAVDVRAFLSALNEVLHVIRSEPFRLSKQIYVTAKQLPLQHLTEALRKVSDTVGADHPELAVAYSSMHNLHATLLGRVLEHKMWQDADNKISDLEEAFGHASEEIREDFNLAWGGPSGAKQSVQAMMALDPKAKWSQNLQQYSDRLDDELAHEAPGATLANVFDAYRREARFRFFTVDAQLKSDCAALVRIGEPLRAIIGEISR
jgi:hypothetical protein